MNSVSDEKIIGVIENALNLKGGHLSIDSCADDVKEWDSLGHVGVLLNLDKFFNGKVGGIQEMATADSVRKIIEVLRHNSLI